MKKSIALKIKRYRYLNHLTQLELSKILNISRATLGKWEIDKHKPSPLACMRIKFKMGIEI